MFMFDKKGTFFFLISIAFTQIKAAQVNGIIKNCHFPNNNINEPIMKMELQKCYINCKTNVKCTHFSWDSVNSICYLKGGYIEQSMSVIIRGMYCGIKEQIKTTSTSKKSSTKYPLTTTTSKNNVVLTVTTTKKTDPTTSYKRISITQTISEINLNYKIMQN